MLCLRFIFQNLSVALRELENEKLRVASGFSLEDLAQPVPKKILNSVLCAFARILATHYPHEESLGPHVAQFFSEQFQAWFFQHFPHLATCKNVGNPLKTKCYGWFLTSLKRRKGKMNKAA